MTIKEIQKVRKYKFGYEVRDELIDGAEYGCPDYIMKSAYNENGDYIGDSKWAYKLCQIWGIKPEKRTPTSNICSIGFCAGEQKWYGWSHRAMCGFGIGSEVKKGDCAYLPTNLEEYIVSLVEFWTDSKHADVKSEIIDDHVHISWEYTDDTNNLEAQKCYSVAGVDEYIAEIKFGRGEWTAENLEDAKQMAKDYAESVS